MVSKAIPKIGKRLDNSKQKRARRESVPDDLSLPSMARILRNMVEENDLEGVAEVLTKMQAHEKSDGFTIQDVSGNGLLQIAALRNFDKMTKMLLDMGFDINYVDDNHGTALQAAIYMDSDNVLKVLLDETRIPQIKVNTVGGYYGCALQVAAFKGSFKYIALLIARGADQDIFIPKSKYGTALQAAARAGSPRLLEQLFHLENIEINRVGGAWGTALQAAAKGDYTEAAAKLRQLARGRVLSLVVKADQKKYGMEDSPDYLAVAKMLLEHGAKVNVKPSGRLQTPINAAASSGHIEMLELLLDYDDASRPDVKAEYGRALLSAITQTFNQKRLPLVEQLVNRGADIHFNAGNGLYNTPLIAAAAMNDVPVVEYLLEISENKKEFMDAETGIYGSALRVALSAPQPANDTALYLIRMGADTRNGDQRYGNILHLAAFANLPEIVRVLLECHQDINAVDTNNQTALHIAAYRGYEQVVEILLDHDAKANLKDIWGDMPLDIVIDVMRKESHPVPSLQGLRNIRDMLLKWSVIENQQEIFGHFQGPMTSLQLPGPVPVRPKARSVFESPKWNPGLKFRAKIVDFLEEGEQEHVLVKDLEIDDLLYKRDSIVEVMNMQGGDYTRKLRWIHLPTNNVRHTLQTVRRALLT